MRAAVLAAVAGAAIAAIVQCVRRPSAWRSLGRRDQVRTVEAGGMVTGAEREEAGE